MSCGQSQYTNCSLPSCMLSCMLFYALIWSVVFSYALLCSCMPYSSIKCLYCSFPIPLWYIYCCIGMSAQKHAFAFWFNQTQGYCKHHYAYSIRNKMHCLFARVCKRALWIYKWNAVPRHEKQRVHTAFAAVTHKPFLNVSFRKIFLQYATIKEDTML